MTQDTRDAVTFTLGTFVTVITIVAMAVRFILLPWLRDHLVKPVADLAQPVAETHRQVSENGHANASPTLPDRLEDLGEKVDEATEAHAQQARDMTALTRVLDEHLRWSDRWVDVVDRELQLLRQRLNDKRENGENES